MGWREGEVRMCMEGIGWRGGGGEVGRESFEVEGQSVPLEKKGYGGFETLLAEDC